MRVALLVLSMIAVTVRIGAAAQPSPQIVSGPSLMTRTAAGASMAPQVSADGRFIVFASHAKNLTTNRFAGLNLNIFRRDLLNNRTELISVDQTGTAGGDDDSSFYSVSADGRFVAFASRAGNLVANDTNAAVDVFLRDMTSRTTRLITADTHGNAPARGDLFTSDPQISANGRWVAFESRSTEFVTVPDSPDTPDVFLRDALLNTTKMVSVCGSGAGSGADSGFASYAPKMSSDAAWVLFLSTAPFGRPSSSSLIPHLFVRDMTANLTWWVTRDLESMLGSYSTDYRIVEHAISADGRTVAFKVTVSANTAAWLFRY